MGDQAGEFLTGDKVLLWSTRMRNTAHPAGYQRLPIGVVVAAIILALLVVTALLAFAWYALRTLDARYPVVADTILIAVPLGGAVLAILYGALGALGMYTRWAGVRAARADQMIRMTQAEVQVAPLATTFHYAVQNEGQAAPAQLVAPIEVVKDLDAWLRWQDEQPHTLLSGRTKAGKTHLATAILERRLKANERVFIVDPHSSGWLNLPTAGSVANPNELKFALVALLSEYTRRMQEREDYKRANNGAELSHNHFGRMTILIDEANAIAEQQGNVWTTFATQLASGSRKVGFALLILAQSPNVEDIGFSAKMRNNFAAIALDMETVQYLIDRERNKERKIALREAAHDMSYPAAAQIGADVWLLDRSALPAGQAPQAALSLMWPGWDYNQGRAVAVLSSETPLSPTIKIDNEVSNGVISPGADVSNVSGVSVSPAEAAKIAVLLGQMKPSDVAKKLDGFNGRNYRELKAKVDAVVAMMSEVTQ